MPERIQLRRTKGWRKPEGTIVVARPSRWGNPYSVGWCCRVECATPAAKHWHVWLRVGGNDGPIITVASKAEAVTDAVRRYRHAVERGFGFVPWPSEIRAGLASRDLACWCPPGDPCHGDVLLELANSGDSR